MTVIEEMNRISSDDSDEQQLGLDTVTYETTIVSRREKIEKISVEKFKETVHKV